MWELTTQEITVNGEQRKILNGMAQFSINGTIQADQRGYSAPNRQRLKTCSARSSVTHDGGKWR